MYILLVLQSIFSFDQTILSQKQTKVYDIICHFSVTPIFYHAISLIILFVLVRYCPKHDNSQDTSPFTLQLHHMGLDRRKPDFDICKQQRCRPACASAHSDQHLCYSLYGKYYVSICYKQIFNILVSLCS